jgi:hypothetical protein
VCGILGVVCWCGDAERRLCGLGDSRRVGVIMIWGAWKGRIEWFEAWLERS